MGEMRRVQFELDPRTVAKIEEIVSSGRTFATTKKDVVRHALGLYFRAVETASSGGHVIFKDRYGGEKEILILELCD